MESEQLKLLARSIVPVDEVVAEVGQVGLRVFIDAAEAASSVASVLERAQGESGRTGRGPVQFCLLSPDLPGEVEIELEGAFPVTPQIKGALKSLPGVVMVEDV